MNVDFTRTDSRKLYSWIKRGALYFAAPHLAPFAKVGDPKKKKSYLYFLPSGRIIVLSQNIGGFSEMIQTELSKPADISDFIKNSLIGGVQYLVDGRNSEVVTKRYVEYLKGDGVEPYVRGRFNDAGESVAYSPAEIKHSLAVLSKYAAPSVSPTINKNQWSVEFYSLFRNGSIEKWFLSGGVNPFSLEVFEKSTVRERGGCHTRTLNRWG